MKTIKQIADSIGVSKQRVYRYIKANRISEAHHEAHHDVHQKHIVRYYDDAAESCIKAHFVVGDVHHDVHQSASEAHRDVYREALHEAHQSASKVHHDTPGDVVIDSLISMLKNELEAKNQQIAELTSALVAAQQTAAAAQALHAGTMKHISVLDTDAEQSGNKKRAWQFWRK